MNDPHLFQGTAATRGSVGEPVRHESAHLHVSGEAAYVDDILEARGTLHAAFGLSAARRTRGSSRSISRRSARRPGSSR